MQHAIFSELTPLNLDLFSMYNDRFVIAKWH